MIKTLRRVQKSSWKPEKRPDGVALPFGRLLFPDSCLNMKSNFYSDFENLDLASERCCPDVRTFFNTEDSRLCGASGRLQWPVWMVAQELVVLTWKLHGIFMDIFLETCDHTHGMK
jgi:hypothetical protein